MKYTLVIFSLAIFAFGCSPPQPSDFVVAGKDVTWSDGGGNVTHVMHITKRDGLTLEGIRKVDTYRTGEIKTTTADRGRIDTNMAMIVTDGVTNMNTVSIFLEKAQVQDTKTNRIFERLGFVFHP
jgi:hypothetical protein